MLEKKKFNYLNFFKKRKRKNYWVTVGNERAKRDLYGTCGCEELCTYCGFGDKDELAGSFVQHVRLKGEDELLSDNGRGLIPPDAVSPSGRRQISAFVQQHLNRH